jgi:putative ATPase
LSTSETSWKPLSERVRPKSLDEIVGQQHLTGSKGIIRQFLEKEKLFSMILYGPPGSGKTTIGEIIRNNLSLDYEYIYFSATTRKTGEFKKIFERARALKKHGKQMILFVDEIHRLNKAQQDIFLPVTESGTVVLIGATTENPSFEVNSALLSRCRLIILKKLDENNIVELLEKALEIDEILRKKRLTIHNDVLEIIAQNSGGDARIALNILDTLSESAEGLEKKSVDVELMKELSLIPGGRYSKKGEEHYDLISAFIKSIRGSDPDAALYYMMRMIEGGEDPKFIARRMIIFASEDIGLADPTALLIAVACFEAVERIGLPECTLNLAEGVIYLSVAIKSNSVIEARDKAKKKAREKPNVPVPLKLRNPVTDMMKKMDYGKNYTYPHSVGGFSLERYLPEELKNEIFFNPANKGKEKFIRERLSKLWGDLKDYGDENK